MEKIKDPTEIFMEKLNNILKEHQEKTGTVISNIGINRQNNFISLGFDMAIEQNKSNIKILKMEGNNG